MEDVPDLELMANRFNRLLREIQQGDVRRTCFQPWEVDFLIDLQECHLTVSRRNEALRRYQKVVNRQVERGELPPVRFSVFIGQRARLLSDSPPSATDQDAAALNS